LVTDEMKKVEDKTEFLLGPLGPFYQNEIPFIV